MMYMHILNYVYLYMGSWNKDDPNTQRLGNVIRFQFIKISYSISLNFLLIFLT